MQQNILSDPRDLLRLVTCRCATKLSKPDFYEKRLRYDSGFWIDRPAMTRKLVAGKIILLSILIFSMIGKSDNMKGCLTLYRPFPHRTVSSYGPMSFPLSILSRNDALLGANKSTHNTFLQVLHLVSQSHVLFSPHYFSEFFIRTGLWHRI